MKHVLVVILLFEVFCLNAQDRRSFPSISPTFSHFIPIKANDFQSEDATYDICPGIEILYNYKLGTSFKLGSGLSYQYVNMISYASGSNKFIVGEISLPVLFTFTEKKNRLSVETGVYAGKFLHFDWYHKSHSQWSKASFYDPRFGYKEQNAFADLYLAVSYVVNKSDLRPAALSPFVKYRVAENWMNLYRESIYYGFKFTISLNRLTKDDNG